MPAMKLHFEPDLDYQADAVAAVADLFRGQERCETLFTVSAPPPPGDPQRDLYAGRDDGGGVDDTLGRGNRLLLSDAALLENLHRVQTRGGLAPSPALAGNDFTVEMETGTGKTYVYLRTAYELNKRYGFTKFVIVVPSVAIREGALKTLDITKDHFRGLYGGVPADHFAYDSKRMGRVRGFATAAGMQFMVVTVAAINKRGTNTIYREDEQTGGERPIDLIRATRPVLIVDEPQSVDGGLKGQGKKALGEMSPLCTLRYSATHVDKHHMVYRLDAVDAYERKLVKRIEVAAAEIEDNGNRPYVRLHQTPKNRGGAITSKLELDVLLKSGVVKRQVKTAHAHDDLAQLTGGRTIYKGYSVGEINVTPGREFVELKSPGEETFLEPGDAHGDVDEEELWRAMIRRTVTEHLEKETRLRPRGIKVLSLLFVDRVADYRVHGDDGAATPGPVADLFEAEYRRAMKSPRFRTLFEGADLAADVSDVHDGYFSRDRKGREVDTSESNAAGRENAGRAYDLIMKDKERLLGLAEPLKFIFSHSALREGWDNPNVFQICTLRDIRTERQRRQTIGRGLRLCVDKTGRRVRGFDTNTLTVVATEGYEAFAAALQSEYEEQTDLRFGVVEAGALALTPVPDAANPGEVVPLGFEAGTTLVTFFKETGLLDASGRVTDLMKRAIAADAVDLPAEHEPHRGQITAALRKLAGGLEVKNADERKAVPVRRAVLDGPEFKSLWDRVGRKTTYRVKFDPAALAAACAKRLAEELTVERVPRTKLRWRKADVEIGRGGVGATETAGGGYDVLREDVPVPDILAELQDRTALTRRTLAKALADSGTAPRFADNPQYCLRVAANVINQLKRETLVDGVAYRPTGDRYAQTLFATEELTGYLRNMVPAGKSVHERVVYDSEAERAFAAELEHATAVKVYAKLPGWFEIPTPLGGYNPDWAVVLEPAGPAAAGVAAGSPGRDRLYFVAETKPTGGLFDDTRRGREQGKVHCGAKHFTALAAAAGDDANPAEYVIAPTAAELLRRAAE